MFHSCPKTRYTPLFAVPKCSEITYLSTFYYIYIYIYKKKIEFPKVMEIFIEGLYKQTLSNDITHLFCHRNIFKAPVILPSNIVSQQGDMKKSVKTDFDICLKIVIFSPVNWFLHLSDSFPAILGPCVSLSSKLLGEYNLTARLAVIPSKRSVKTGPELGEYFD